jgi:quercetin dioxygenase-like cupin family protein
MLNRIQNRVEEVVAAHGEPPWIVRLVLTDEVVATLICTPHGNSSRRHSHPDNDEFWVVMGGELRWEIEGEEPMLARNGDIMLVPKGKAHNIVTVSEEPALRLAIGITDIPHVDPESGEVWS